MIVVTADIVATEHSRALMMIASCYLNLKCLEHKNYQVAHTEQLEMMVRSMIITRQNPTE